MDWAKMMVTLPKRRVRDSIIAERKLPRFTLEEIDYPRCHQVVVTFPNKSAAVKWLRMQARAANL